MNPGADSPAALSLLMVEDDRAAIEVMGLVVSKRFPEWQVCLAYDGEMGLEMFRKQLPDLVITDINMPKLDGVQMAEAIKAIRPSTQIIVLTAYSDKIHEEHFRKIGIGEHLLKPVLFAQLFNALDKAVGEIRSGRE